MDVITNKATVEEMKGIKHHLIGYLDSTCINNHVIDYKNAAVPLVYWNFTIELNYKKNLNFLLKIDDLLKNDVVPILVGGTHYYIQSVIWNILIDKAEESNFTVKKTDFSNRNSSHTPTVS